jgi:transcriptional regulator with XRE-family HTH domain
MRNSLRLARKAAQLTQEQLAARAGVTVAVISRLEKELDEDDPSIIVSYQTAVRIARALHVAPEDVFVVKDLVPRDSSPKRKGRPSAKHRQRLKVVKATLLAGTKREDAHHVG